MFRLNRNRAIGLLLTTFIIYFLFLSSTNTNTDFRKRTEEGLSRRHGILQGDLSDEAFRTQTNQKLDDILAQKDGKTEQRPLRASDEGAGPAAKQGEEQDPEDAEDKSSSVAGRKTVQKAKEKPRYPLGKTDEKQDSLNKASDEDDDDETTKQMTSSDPGKDLARETLQEYMKKPLIIFSKSYCPHSKRAKHLLLDLYKIIPAPLVVELDQLTERVPLPPPPPKNADDEDDEDDEAPHTPQAPTLGQKLQDLLSEISGRRTVPNIMVGTTSIGGNDLIWEMHEQGTLAERLRELGGKRIVSVEVRNGEGEGTEGKKEKRGVNGGGHQQEEKRSNNKKEKMARRDSSRVGRRG